MLAISAAGSTFSIRNLKNELGQTEAALAQLDHDQRQHGLVDLDDASEILASVPDLSKPLANAEPELLQQVYNAFRLRVEIDRNKGVITLKALVSSAFDQAKSLADIACSDKTIAGAGFEPATFGL